MSEIERIKDQLLRTFDGDAWYGPSMREALSGVNAQKATARPIAGAHNIWEIVLHVSAWQGAVRTRLEEGRIDIPTEGDWPSITDPSDESWEEVLAALRWSHEQVVMAICRLTDDRLDDALGSERDRVTGGGVSVYVTLHGLVQHCVYHAGQISLLKRM